MLVRGLYWQTWREENRRRWGVIRIRWGWIIRGTIIRVLNDLTAIEFIGVVILRRIRVGTRWTEGTKYSGYQGIYGQVSQV